MTAFTTGDTITDDLIGRDDWVRPTFSTGWEDWYASDGDDRRKFKMRRFGDLIHMQGLIRRSGATLSSGASTILTLPTGYTPNATKFLAGFSSSNGGTVQSVRASSGGILEWHDDGPDMVTAQWISLDGLVYPLDSPG